MLKKALLFFVLLLTLSSATYLIVGTDSKRRIVKALALAQQQKYLDAESIIDQLPNSAERALYKGYLEQIRGRLEYADRYLASVSLEARKEIHPELLAQIALAQASNAYLLGLDEKCIEHIQTASTVQPGGEQVPFFAGLECYLQKSYGEALRHWGQDDSSDNGSWPAVCMTTLFPRWWRNLHMAHAFLEEGDVIRARELLEKESRMAAIQAEYLPLINLFLGYSYIKESRKVACVDRGSFYRLAHFYFERGHVPKHFERQQREIAAHLEHEAATLLLTDRDDKTEEGLGFVHILQAWEVHEAIDRLATLLATHILSNKEQENLYLCALIRQQFQGTMFHHLLTETMLTALAKELKVGETENLFFLWAVVEQLSLTPKQAAKEVASLAAAEIFETIKIDDATLSKTRNFLAFWEKLGRSGLERERMARDLLFHAKLFWHNEKLEKKGERLMEIALKITNHDPLIVQEIEIFLSTLYVQAENSNMIRRLTLIYEAMEHFQINRQGLITKATVANHLADAEYLFHSRNYLAARRHANWVLKLEPDNQGARRLAGLSSFHLRDYSKAICHLQLLSYCDEESDQALLLSYAFSTPLEERDTSTIKDSTVYLHSLPGSVLKDQTSGLATVQEHHL